MKKSVWLVAGAIAVSTIVATPASSATKPTQTQRVTKTYVLAVGFRTGGYVLGVNDAGAEFDTPSWARHASVVVHDASGLPTAGSLEQLDGSLLGFLTESHPFCGQLSPVPIDPTRQVWVYVREGLCNDGTLAAGTTGSITVTFTN